jgi:hypothetical protein
MICAVLKLRFEVGCDNFRCLTFYSRCSNLVIQGIFELIDLKRFIPLPRGCNGPCACVGHSWNVHPHTECLSSHPISECSTSTPDRRCWPGFAPGPPAPVLQQVGPAPPPACSSSIPEQGPRKLREKHRRLKVLKQLKWVVTTT